MGSISQFVFSHFLFRKVLCPQQKVSFLMMILKQLLPPSKLDEPLSQGLIHCPISSFRVRGNMSYREVFGKDLQSIMDMKFGNDVLGEGMLDTGVEARGRG